MWLCHPAQFLALLPSRCDTQAWPPLAVIRQSKLEQTATTAGRKQGLLNSCYSAATEKTVDRSITRSRPSSCNAMTSNMRNRGPSGNAFQRGCPDTLVAVILFTVNLEVPHELPDDFRRPNRRRVKLPIELGATTMAGVSTNAVMNKVQFALGLLTLWTASQLSALSPCGKCQSNS